MRAMLQCWNLKWAYIWMCYISDRSVDRSMNSEITSQHDSPSVSWQEIKRTLFWFTSQSIVDWAVKNEMSYPGTKQFRCDLNHLQRYLSMNDFIWCVVGHEDILILQQTSHCLNAHSSIKTSLNNEGVLVKVKRTGCWSLVETWHQFLKK